MDYFQYQFSSYSEPNGGALFFSEADHCVLIYFSGEQSMDEIWNPANPNRWEYPRRAGQCMRYLSLILNDPDYFYI